jgi:amino acid adenylation domain-containing protein
MADDAQLQWVISDMPGASDLWPAAVQRLDGPALWHSARQASANPSQTQQPTPHPIDLPAVTGDDVAYVIYTSGSTGRPKGTVVRHRGLWQLGLATAQQLDLTQPLRVLQFASMSFDAALLEILMAWMHGGSLHLIEASTMLNLSRLAAVMAEQNVDTAWMPPSLAALIDARATPSLRTLFVGGERCPAGLTERLGPQVRLVNCYGPTETTVCPTIHACAIDEAGEWPLEGPPIGRPLPGHTTYVLDAHGQLAPPRVPGELYIGGTGLALGYLYQPTLTAERFVPHPFETGQRLYRTGDLVRWDHAGRLHFLGRIDHQVKVRGMRVELGEIEAALAQLQGVQQAVLAAPTVRDELMLVAHVVPAADAPEEDEAWRQALARQLPMHMVPSMFMRHAALPHLPNGKVDRKALPEPDASRLPQTPLMGPRDAVELSVLQLWEEILGRQGFGILDNFFDLGGHSLKAIRMLGRIQQTFGITLSVSALTQTPTVEAVAAAIRAQTPASTSSLVAIQPLGIRPPIYFVHAAGGSVMCYHELARHMSPEQPVFGLQAQGIEAGTHAAPDLPAMARHYIDEIRAVQPQGPYRLAGWSMGGNIVYEMANQLMLQGEGVALLGFLDSSTNVFDDPTPLRDNAAVLAEMFGNEFDVTADMLRTLPQDNLIETAVSMAESHQWLPPGFTVDQAHRILHVYRSSETSIKQHKPQPLTCEAVLYRTHEKIEGEEDNDPEDRGWGTLIGGGLTIHPVPGNHINMVMAPHSQVLAQVIERDLKAVLPANLLVHKAG